MHTSIWLTIVSALVTNASPVARQGPALLSKRAAAPTVQISSGTIVGSTASGVDTFNGIPFAQPPVGNLRLAPPQPIVGSLGTVNAVGTPRACPQQILPSLNITALTNEVIAELAGSGIIQTLTDTGEDCLTLNVQRPANISETTKLPVLVWIYGGGFEFGSTQTYDGTTLIQQSIQMGGPFLFVQMNYRLSAFGFLAGKELQADGSTNLGLRDQRLALQWVQDNIAAFGGDATKVTIWGESAGAISVFDHTIINGGDNSYKNGKLFRGAIMDSGSVIPAEPVTTDKAQNVYNTVVDQAGCSSSADTLACLRSVDYATFLAASNSLPGIFSYRSIDLAYLPRPDPSNKFFSLSPELSVGAGAFVKVPVIIGDQEDEGTLFSLTQSNVTTTDQLITYIASFLPSNPNRNTLASGLVALYPDITQDLGAYGSPFRTGALNNVYPQFKRLAAILGDLVFTIARRSYLSTISTQVPTWSYLSTYLYGTPILGTFHASDILFAFGTLGTAAVPTQSIMGYYTSFVNHLDPNAMGISAPLIEWPNWDDNGRNLVDFGLLNTSIIKDDFREATYQYLRANPTGFRV